MEAIERIIKKSIMFSPMTNEEKKLLAHSFIQKGYQRTISPGELLTCAKDPASFYFLLEKGSLLLEYDEGKSFVAKTGDFLGPGVLSDTTKYKATAIALEDGLVHVIDSESINTLMLDINIMDPRTGFLKEKEMEII